MIRKRSNQKEIPTPKTEVGKNKSTINKYLYLAFPYRKSYEQLFPNRRPLSYPNLDKNMKTHIRFKQHKNRLININQMEPQQKYRLGTISNKK